MNTFVTGEDKSTKLCEGKLNCLHHLCLLKLGRWLQ